VVGARWFGAKGHGIERIELDEAFVLDERARHVLALADVALDDRSRQTYSLALTGATLRPAQPGEGAWRSLAVAMADGRTIPSVARDADRGPSPSAALVCRPALALGDLAPDAIGTERDLGTDQSHTSVVLGETLLLKAYRRLQSGLDPDLEMTAFLGEEAAFPAVPRLAGFAEVVAQRGEPTTVAMLQEYIVDGADAFETIADQLAAWMSSPGEVSVEFATEVAADLGTLTAGLHAAVAGGHGLADFAPREATRAEVRAWAAAAHTHLAAALDVASGDTAALLRDLAPRIAADISVIDALPTAPEVIRAHGDYHLGQVLIAPDGFRIIDFEGEPLSPVEDRRAHRHPLRDVASMLRSLDHVARSARRRAEASQGGPLGHVGLDIEGWIARGRERFVDAYRAGLLERRVFVDIDPELLHAFEVDKELYEIAYAATYLPSWSYASTEGLRALFAADRVA
jgi:maltose alpha-D-glucosyltransferase/alpha-amylase